MSEKFKLNKQVLRAWLPSLVLSLVPMISIIVSTANFGLGLLTFILCTAGSHFGWELGKKVHDYAPVTAIFGKSASDLAWKKFMALHGSKITGFFIGLALPWLIFDGLFNDEENFSKGALKNQQAGEISKQTDKILKDQYKVVEQDIQQYGDFSFKTGIQSAEQQGGVYVMLRYEPKSNDYAKSFQNQFLPNILQKPIMQPLEVGIDKEYSGIPAKLLRKTILSLGIEPVYYLPLEIFSFTDFYELYKTYNDTHTGFEDDVLKFIFTGERKLDSYGDNLDDYLAWRRYVSSTSEDGRTVYLHNGADYEHWYFEHDKASEEEYKKWLRKYVGVGTPTEFETAYIRLKTFVERNAGTNATTQEARNSVPNPKYITVYGYANNLDKIDDTENGVPLLRVQYYKKFVQFVSEHWQDYPDGMKKHREYESLESYKKNEYGSFAGYVFGTDWPYYPYGLEGFEEMRSAFAKENGAVLQEEYKQLFDKIYSAYKNVHIEERKDLFRKLVDLSDCKVYIDYRCAAASDDWDSLSIILDKRGVLVYKLQIEPNKWVEAETYFTLRDNSKDFLQW